MKKLTADRNELLIKEFKNGTSKEELALKYEIGLIYVRDILRNSGLIPKKLRKDTTNRNIKIRQMFKNSMSSKAIAVKMKITTARVSQILNEDQELSRKMKSLRGISTNEELLEAKEKALKLIAIGKNAKDIVDAIGLKVVKRLKYRFNFSIYKLLIKRKEERVIELYKDGVKPKDISVRVGCTSDYVYMLLRSAGFKIKMLKDAKHKRDESLYAFIENGGTTAQAAKKWEVSKRMVENIHKKVGKQPNKKG